MGEARTSDPIRVLHFGRFFNEDFGGLERQVMLLLEELNKDPDVQADNLVAADRLKSETLSIANYKVHKVASFGVFASTALAPLMIWRARRMLKKGHYRIAHLHFPDPLSALCALFFPRRTKVVITWHSDIARQRFFRMLLAPLLNAAIRRADFIVAATPRHFESSKQLGACRDPEKMVAIPFGFPLAEFAETPAVRTAARELRDRYPDKRIVFAVGRHIYYKGFEYLIRAMAGLPDAVLLLGGRGPLTPALKDLAREIDVSDRVVFAGRIPNEELVNYYHACDVYCMPSIATSEGFGIVQVEAMACKKPVVCCELNNGVTYVNRHEETGLVAEPQNVESLQKALLRLLEDEGLRKKFGEQGYRRVWEEFTTERMANDMLQLYRSVLGDAT